MLKDLDNLLPDDEDTRACVLLVGGLISLIVVAILVGVITCSAMETVQCIMEPQTCLCKDK